MEAKTNFDVIIIGGSYSGLSAAMSLGRALRKVLVIDSGKPCNIQTPHSHNFITQDGQTPTQISASAKAQVAKYDTIQFYHGLAIRTEKTEKGFEIQTQTGERFVSKKLLLATGLKDIMPEIEGFAACWGISVIHCPYCHGYEVKNEKTSILANGDLGFEFVKLIAHWTKELTLLTDGKSSLTEEQIAKIRQHGVQIIEKEIDHFEHVHGNLQHIVFKDRSTFALKALYARPPFVQHSDIPLQLGCELTEQGLLKVDVQQRTNIAGVYACGDNANLARAVSVSVASGTMAGAFLNKELIDEAF